LEANPDHLARLLGGVTSWNAWRADPERKYILAPDLEDAIFRSIDFTGVDLSKANLAACRFEGCKLDKANLIGASLSGTRAPGASLRGAKLISANLHGTDLRGADLTGADLSGATLTSVNLDDACLAGARLESCVLNASSLRRTNLQGARLSAVLAAVDLSAAIGLSDIVHVGPSTIGVDTLYRTHGRLPDAFLRDAGVPQNLISYIPSFTATPIDFQSCFISYSDADRAFAERLHRDLRHQQIRCWFAPEDLKIGDRFRREIDRSIYLHDRLLVILSTASLKSSWVEDEVEAALERERQTGDNVLFPIRIDGEIESTSNAWAASLRRTRHIGDFTGWSVPEKYAKSFEYLLRDLKKQGMLDNDATTRS
jgi:hypothetical protein